MPRVGSTALAFALAVSGVVAPLAAPARAATAGDVLVELRDSGNNGNGIYRRPAPAGPLTAIAPEEPTANYRSIDVSRDGTRLAYAQDVATPEGVFAGQRIVVRDIGGRVVRFVESIGPTVQQLLTAPSLSPDGYTVVWTVVDYATDPPSYRLRRASVAGGPSVTIRGSNGLSGGVFVNATTLVAGTIDSTHTIPLGGGTSREVVGNREPSSDFAFSPDGKKVAWTYFDNDGAQVATTTIQVADVTTSGATTTFGTPRTLYTGGLNRNPAWSRNGQTVYFHSFDNDSRHDGSGVPGPGDLWSVPAAGGMAGPVEVTAADESAVAAGVLDATVPPQLQVENPTLNGTSATFRVTNAPRDLSGVLIHRGSRAGIYAPLRADGTFVYTGLTVGTAYAIQVDGVDRSGNGGPLSRGLFFVATAPPAISVPDPTSTPSAGLPFTVRFGPSANRTTTRYTVDYRRVAVQSAFTRWLTTSARQGTFGYTSRPVAVPQGSVWQFRAQARDSYGNLTALVTGPTKAVVPFDQTRATTSSTASTATGGDRYLGSVRVLTRAGQKAVLTVTGDRLQVVGERSTTGGRFDVYLKNASGVFVRIGYHVDTYATARKARQVLFTTTPGTVATRTYEIRWVTGPTSTRKTVALDAFGVRR